jgi:hypothetical protein
VINGEDTTNNVHELRPQNDGNDNSVSAATFSISASLIPGLSVGSSPATGYESVELLAEDESPAPTANDPAEGLATGEADHDFEVQWADGTPTDVHLTSRRRRWLRSEPAGVSAETFAEAPEHQTRSFEDNVARGAGVDQAPLATSVHQTSRPEPPTELTQGAVWAGPGEGAAPPSPAQGHEHWSPEHTEHIRVPAEAESGNRRGTRFLAVIAVTAALVLVVLAVVEIATSGGGHAPRIANTIRKQQAGAHKVVRTTAPITTPSKTATTQAKPRDRRKARSHKRRASRKTLTNSTVTSAPVVTTTTPAEITTTTPSEPSAQTPRSTSNSSNTHSSSKTTGGLPDTQQTDQQP